jgi:nitroimidazol reductase NimA-like FMN-containing flavoprotein (pyridoxamine 5'-phosphate oxidase superfamily)
MEFHQMRRGKQALSQEECLKILKDRTSGVLALLGEEGYPYAVPLSFVYFENHLFFHSALTGQKIDDIKACPKASFCVIDKDQVVPEKFTTYFRSVIASGNISIIEDEEMKKKALLLLALKYAPDNKEGCLKETVDNLKRVSMLDFEIERLTGKEAIELKRQNNQ